MLTSSEKARLIKTHQNQSMTDRAEWAKYARWYRSDFYTGVNNRAAVAGSSNTDGANGSVGPANTNDDANRNDVTLETNYAYAYTDTMVANVCPTSPSVTVTAKREGFEEAARYREALINQTLTNNKTHEKLWRLSTEASLYRRCFMKGVWSAKKEMPTFRVLDPRFVWFDMSAEEWEDIRYLIEVTVLTKQEFDARVKKGKEGFYRKQVAEKANPTAYPSWLRQGDLLKDTSPNDARDVFKWVVIYEFYDFTGEGSFCHFLENVEEPLFKGRLPYKYVRNPYHMLTFNDNLTDIGGLSDIKLISTTQARLNELDTLELQHAQASIPSLLVHKGAVDNAEDIMSALKNNEIGSMIGIDAHAQRSLSDILGVTPQPQLSPSFDIMRNRAQSIIEFVLGIPQYSRGQIGSADVATEVALADAATRTRNGRRQKKVNDVLGWMGHVIVSLYEELLPDEASVPLRISGNRYAEVTRQNMELRSLVERNVSAPQFEIEAVPTNALENNRLVQIKNILETFGILSQGAQIGVVDMPKLYEKLLHLLSMPDVMKTDKQQFGVPGAPAMPGAPGPAAPPTDTAAGGGLQGVTEPPSVMGTAAAGGAGDGRSQLGIPGGLPQTMQPG